MITTTNPRTGVSAATGLEATSATEVDHIAERAQQAAFELAARGREGRARMLDAIAVSLDASRDGLVQTADEETGLGVSRLNGELSRSIFQFRLFAEALREGSYIEAMIDHATETVLGAAPDLRRMLVPLGPVAVFGSSNFPFAFSVAGGDTASALAAGCPVVLKAHSSHPLTSLRSFEALVSGLNGEDAPDGTVGLIFGQAAGSLLVAHPAITAVGFTGSLAAGEALQSVINDRDEPIPFYGELSSLNPLVITANAAGARSAQIAQGLFTSFTGSAGQLCTKPGIAFVPTGAAGDGLVEAIRDLVERAEGQVLLNGRIFNAYQKISECLINRGGAGVAARTAIATATGGFLAAPTLLTTRAMHLTAELTEECFGPLMVVARYENLEELDDAFRQLPSSLTATVHIEDNEPKLLTELTDRLATRAGRIVYNGFPTGVRVSWAQHHGGPWPATNSIHTSVGVTAIRRFLRPFVWQDAPQSVLPEELRDGPATVPRRLDGRIVLPAEG
jgi:NADP-dependent aldehyde dehydrogenase